MAAVEAELVDPKELPPIDDYQFSGDSLTVTKKRAFIVNFREEGSVFHAARLTRISRQCVYNWIQADEEFAQAVEESKEDCYDQAESSVFKKALAGDSLLLMFYLKAHRPKFRDRVSIDVEVVRNEIEERMSQLNLRQLPAMTTEFLNSASNLRNESIQSLPVDFQQFSHQPEQIQKESDSESSAEE